MSISRGTTITDDHVYRLDLYFGPFVYSHQKLPQRCLMQFQITYIEFDFEDDLYSMTEQETEDFYDDYVGTFWEAEDGDDYSRR